MDKIRELQEKLSQTHFKIEEECKKTPLSQELVLINNSLNMYRQLITLMLVDN